MARSDNTDALQPIIEGWLRTLTREDAVDTLNAQGVPCGPIYTAEDVHNDPHVKAHGMIMPIVDPEFGTFGFARSTPHLSSAPELTAYASAFAAATGFPSLTGAVALSNMMSPQSGAVMRRSPRASAARNRRRREPPLTQSSLLNS